MTVQADRWRMAGGFVGGGPAPRDHAFSRSRALRGLVAVLPRTTPARVRAGLITILVLACCLAAALSVAATGVRAGFQTMGRQTEPEVTASTGLYLSLTDMDSQLANVLLIGGAPSLTSDRAADLALYASDRETADADLQQAAAAAAGSPAVQRELRTVLDGLGQYETLVADAILIDQKTGRKAGPAPAAVLAYYERATDLMRTGILPRVTALTSHNAAGVGSAYGAGMASAGAGTAVAAGLGSALIAALAAFQAYLAARFRRRVNPPLAAATLLALIVTGCAWGAAGAAESRLRVARFSAFDSIIALSQARAVSYDANADESRYLVDPARRARYQQEFLADSQRLAAVGNATIGSYHSALARDIAAYRSGDSGKRVLFGGYLGAEFRNFTFEGEPQEALRALLAYQAYQSDDQVFRAMASRNMNGAVAFDSGNAPGQSDWAFNQYAAALSSVIALNQKAFTAAVSAGEETAGWGSAGSGRAAVLPAMVLVLAGLGYLGVRPRLAEYQLRG